MMKRQVLKGIALAAIALSSQNLAAQSVANFHINGNIPTHTNLNVQDLDGSSAKQIFSTVSSGEFSAGEIVVSDAIQLRNIVTNSPVYLQITNNGWTLPAGYDGTNGPKKTDGSDSHFLLQVNSGTLSASSGNISIEGNFGTQYVAVTNSAQNMLKLGDVSGSNRMGMANGSADIDAKVMLDTVYDIPGTYSVELELTITAQP